jgi:heptaprenyl diphosphate synthase
MTHPTATDHALTSASRDDRLIAGFAALAIAIHILEAAFPSPLPGVKPGLANVVTLIVYLRHGLRIAAWVAAMRVLVGSLLVGTFLSPTFMLSATGAAFALAALALTGRLGGPYVGPVGLSVVSALTHMSGQICVAYLLFIPHPALLKLVSVLLTAALLFGAVSGLIAANVMRLLDPPARTAA